MQAAAVTVVIGSYVAMLTGGLFHRMIFWCFWLVIMLYMLAYFIFAGYYRSKMESHVRCVSDRPSWPLMPVRG